MFIDRAIFRIGQQEEIVTLETITHHENYLIVKENLYCAVSDCNCRIIYVPHGLKVAHFKKWKGDSHSEDCPFYKETIKNNKAYRIVGKSVARLNDNHASKVLKDTFHYFNEKPEDKETRMNKQKQSYKARKNKVLEKQESLDFEDIIVTLPTTALDTAEVREGERNPTVRKRLSILDFNLSDIGLTFSTVGFLDSITIEDQFATLVITDDYDRVNFTIYLEEVFYANSHFNFNSLLKGLRNQLNTSDEIIVTCIGEVVFREGQFGMLVFKDYNIRFNGEFLEMYLLSKNTLF